MPAKVAAAVCEQVGLHAVIDDRDEVRERARPEVGGGGRAPAPTSSIVSSINAIQPSTEVRQRSASSGSESPAAQSSQSIRT